VSLPRSAYVIGGLYALAIAFALASLGYGEAWRRFADSPDNYVYFQMRVANGPVRSLSSVGFGLARDWLVKVEGSPEEFLFPGISARPFFGPDGGPVIDPESAFRVGRQVSIRASGGLRPVILEASAREERGTVTILSYELGARRYRAALANGKKVGDEYTRQGKALLAGAPLAHLLYFLSRRLFRARGGRAPVRSAA
jgi:hypothetical protein